MDWIQDPFPHRFGTGFFPEDLYQAMLDSLSTLESRCKFEKNDPAWEYIEFSGRTEPLRGRLSYGESDPLWKHVFSLIRNQYPEERMGIGLYHSLPGFDLLPHTDFPNKKETTMYYITDKEIPGIGTALFKPRSKWPTLSDPTGQAHFEMNYMDLVLIAPFVPNGWMTFQRSDISFNGVLPCPVDRWAIYSTRYID